MRIWQVVHELTRLLQPDQWMLIGGLMVDAIGRANGFPPIRVTEDIDMLANMAVLTRNLRLCTAAVERLGFEVKIDSRGSAYRFERFDTDSALHIDLLAPDRLGSRVRLVTRSGPTFQVPAGSQALKRCCYLEATWLDGSATTIPVPTLHGAIVLKAAAAVNDRRDPQRHISDLAWLLAMVDDPFEMIEAYAGSDRRRIRRITPSLKPFNDWPWIAMPPESAERGYSNLMVLAQN